MELIIGLGFGIAAILLFIAWLKRQDTIKKKTTGIHTITAKRLPAFLGDGQFEQEIVGESFYQGALEVIAGERDEEGVEEYIAATILPENDNTHDANAVAIFIGDEKVGYFARSEASEIREELAAIGASQGGQCEAVVVGGWDRGRGNVGHFGVKLDLARPLQIE